MHHKITPKVLDPNEKNHARREANPTRKIQVPTNPDPSRTNISFAVSEVEKASTILYANSTHEFAKELQTLPI
jgi:hypothetical protein